LQFIKPGRLGDEVMPAAEDRQRLLALRTRARRSRALGAGRCGRSAPRTRSPSDLLSRASVGSRCYWQGGHIRWRAQTSRRSRCRECSRRRIQSGSGDTLAEAGVRLQVPRAESTPATSRRRSSPRPRSRRLGRRLARNPPWARGRSLPIRTEHVTLPTAVRSKRRLAAATAALEGELLSVVARRGGRRAR